MIINTTLAAVAIFCFILLVMHRLIDKDHTILKLVLIMFVALALIIIGKTALDDNTQCDVMLQNATVSGNVTHYEYGPECVTTNTNTAGIFYKLLMGFMILFMLYVNLYFLWYVVMWIKRRFINR